MMQQTVPMNQGPMTQGPAELPLRGLHLPAEPGFWPLAPGWWVLFGLLLVLLIVVAVKWYQRRQRKKQFEAIQSQLGAITFDFQSHQDKRQLLSELSLLLRRFEKFHQRQDQAVTLTGGEWMAHLNSYHKDQPFTPYEQLLTQAVYLPEVEFEPDELTALIQRHIEKVVMTPEKKMTKLKAKSQAEAAHV